MKRTELISYQNCWQKELLGYKTNDPILHFIISLLFSLFFFFFLYTAKSVVISVQYSSPMIHVFSFKRKTKILSKVAYFDSLSV